MQPTGVVEITEKLWKIFNVLHKTGWTQNSPDLEHGLRAAM